MKRRPVGWTELKSWLIVWPDGLLSEEHQKRWQSHDSENTSKAYATLGGRSTANNGGVVGERDDGDHARVVAGIRVALDLCGGVVGARDADAPDGVVEVAVGGKVGVRPVDHAASPGDGALAVSVGARRPDRNLDTRRGGRVLVLDGAVLKGHGRVALLQGANDVAVHNPLQRLGLPVERVRVEVGGRVGKVLVRLALGRRVVGVPEEEVVGLNLGRLHPRPFPVDLVLDVGHGDSGSNNAGPLGRL